MTYTKKQANANNSKWTPPELVKKQRMDPNGYFNNHNRQNSALQHNTHNRPNSPDGYHSPHTHSKPIYSSYHNQNTHNNYTKNHNDNLKTNKNNQTHYNNNKNNNNINKTHNKTNYNNYNNKNNNKKIYHTSQTDTHPNKEKTTTNSNYIERKDDILQPLKTFVESLPSFLQSSTQETALVLLNCTDELDRRSEMAKFFRQDSSYIPISARIKYNLTSSELLCNDHIYLENAAKCATVVDITQNLVRKYTFNVVQREVWAAKQHLICKYIKH